MNDDSLAGMMNARGSRAFKVWAGVVPIRSGTHVSSDLLDAILPELPPRRLPPTERNAATRIGHLYFTKSL